jgi:hypothetical protein
VWVRRGVLLVLLGLAAAALANVFGQRPATFVVNSPVASLKVYAPVALRSGDVFTARFHIYAHRDIKQATLILDTGWFEAMTFNGIAPQPLGEGSTNGRPTFQFGHVPAGKSFIAFFSFQANPTNLGQRSTNVELDDGSTKLLVVHRTITIWP